MRFMYGRYGMYGFDAFTVILLAVYITVGILRAFFGGVVGWVLSFIQTFCLVYWFFRFFSRNIPARMAEKQWAEKITKPTGRFIKLQYNRIKDFKTHVYVKCPSCKANLRLPRRKGKNTVKCPRCSGSFTVGK